MKRKIFLFGVMFLMILGCGMTANAAPKKMADGTMFDAQYYAQNNPDVVAAFGLNENLLYQHYVLAGKFEGRRPCEPIKTRLIDLELYEGSKCYEKGEALEDTWGNVYMNAINVYFGFASGSYKEAVYLINGKYENVSGCLVYEKCDSTYGKGYLEIYADGRHLYTSPLVDDDTKPIFFDVNIGTNCHKMEIRCIKDGSHQTSLILANAVVY